MALTTDQTQELKGLITQRRQALIAELRRDAEKVRGESFRELAGPAPDAGDESVASLIADLDQAEWGRDIEELRGLDAARERIGGDNFGVCVDCGGEISFERLRATPAAIRRSDCQTGHEKTFAGSERPSL